MAEASEANGPNAILSHTLLGLSDDFVAERFFRTNDGLLVFRIFGGTPCARHGVSHRDFEAMHRLSGKEATNRRIVVHYLGCGEAINAQTFDLVRENDASLSWDWDNIAAALL